MAAIVVAALWRVPLDAEHSRPFIERETLVKGQPVWLQAVETLVLLDFIAYWCHRAFHGNGILWPFHAGHHSSTELDWLSSVRVHPVNDLVTRVVQVMPLLAAGFDPRVLAATAPAFTLYALFIHANVPWPYGPLRYLVSSPAFHRWHHSTEAEGGNKHFTGLLPLWDVLFGTFYMPAGQPTALVVTSTSVPGGFLGKLAYPIRR